MLRGKTRETYSLHFSTKRFRGTHTHTKTKKKNIMKKTIKNVKANVCATNFTAQIWYFWNLVSCESFRISNVFERGRMIFDATVGNFMASKFQRRFIDLSRFHSSSLSFYSFSIAFERNDVKTKRIPSIFTSSALSSPIPLHMPLKLSFDRSLARLFAAVLLAHSLQCFVCFLCQKLQPNSWHPRHTLRLMRLSLALAIVIVFALARFALIVSSLYWKSERARSDARIWEGGLYGPTDRRTDTPSYEDAKA